MERETHIMRIKSESSACLSAHLRSISAAKFCADLSMKKSTENSISFFSKITILYSGYWRTRLAPIFSTGN